MAVDDFRRFIDGEISGDQLQSRISSQSTYDPIQDWHQWDNSTGLYDNERGRTGVGDIYDMRYDDLATGRYDQDRGAYTHDSVRAGRQSEIASGAFVGNSPTVDPVIDQQNYDISTNYGRYNTDRLW